MSDVRQTALSAPAVWYVRQTAERDGCYVKQTAERDGCYVKQTAERDGCLLCQTDSPEHDGCCFEMCWKLSGLSIDRVKVLRLIKRW
jgi:hypothetical protein